MLIHLMDVKTDDVTDYKKKSLLLAFPHCTGKCEGCQSKHLLGQNNIKTTVDAHIITELYNQLKTHEAVVMAGLEPFDSFNEVLAICEELLVLNYKQVDIVIYTGYTEDEIKDKGYYKEILKVFNNSMVNINSTIIIKVGRYDAINYGKSYFNEELGVTLATENQYTIKFCK